MVRVGQQGPSRGDHRCASYASIAGATLFVFSFIFFAIAMGHESKSETMKEDNFDDYKHLKPALVHELWEGRRKAQTAHLLAELSASIGWLTLLPAVGSLGQIAGGQDGRSAVRFMTACFQGAAMISVIDFTFQAGLHSMTDWLSTWPIMQPDYGAAMAKYMAAVKAAAAALCQAKCPDGVCDSMADHNKTECAECAMCHDHDNDGIADHGHDDMAQDMKSGGAAATAFTKYFSYTGLLAVSGGVRATESGGKIHQLWYDLPR